MGQRLKARSGAARPFRLAAAGAALLAVMLTAAAATGTTVRHGPSAEAAPPAPARHEAPEAGPRRADMDSAGASFTIVGRSGAQTTGPLEGTAYLRYPTGRSHMRASELVLGQVRGQDGDYGYVKVVERRLPVPDPAPRRAAGAIEFPSGLEFQVDRIPEWSDESIYTGPVTLVPEPRAAPTGTVPVNRTYRLDGPVRAYEGANGVTSAEAIGTLDRLTVVVNRR